MNYKEKLHDVQDRVVDEYEQRAPRIKSKGRDLMNRTREVVQDHPGALLLGGAAIGAAAALLYWAAKHRDSDDDYSDRFDRYDSYDRYENRSKYDSSYDRSYAPDNMQSTPRQNPGSAQYAQSYDRSAGSPSALTPTTQRSGGDRAGSSTNPTRSEPDS